MYCEYGIFPRLREADSRGYLSVFDTLYELQGRILINDKAIDSASVPYLSLKEGLVWLAQAEDLCVLEVCI
jgi:hypothetical protein